MAALSDFVKTALLGAVRLTDGSASPVNLDLLYEEGNLTLSGVPNDTLNQTGSVVRRGKRISDYHGDRVFPQFTISGFLTNENTIAPGSLQAFVTRSTPYASNVSTSGQGRPYTFTLRYTVAATAFGESDWVLTLNDCAPTGIDFGEAMDGTKFTITGEVRGAIEGALQIDEAA